MRISDGFDRISSEDELHQVCDFLGALERSGWTLPGDQSVSQTADLWADEVLEPADAESLAELFEKKPQLTN